MQSSLSFLDFLAPCSFPFFSFSYRKSHFAYIVFPIIDDTATASALTVTATAHYCIVSYLYAIFLFPMLLSTALLAFTLNSSLIHNISHPHWLFFSSKRSKEQGLSGNGRICSESPTWDTIVSMSFTLCQLFQLVDNQYMLKGIWLSCT